MSLLGNAHEKIVFTRRVAVIAGHLSKLLPPGSKVLDIGCGNGLIDYLIMQQRPDVSITGLDVLVRDKTFIPVSSFDGEMAPYEDESYDCVLFVDVLHHDKNPVNLLKEARRVSKSAIIIKDHVDKGLFANVTLRFMDWVGNVRFGVNLPYNYWAEHEWRKKLADLSLSIEYWNPKVGLYPYPASLLFDRSLHFIAKLKKVDI